MTTHRKLTAGVAALACAVFALTLSVRGADAKLDTAMRIEKALPEAALVKPEKPRKVLIYTRASGFVHSSIPIGAQCFEALGKKTGAFEVTEITDDPAVFDGDKLKDFDCIVLMSTTGHFLTPNRPGRPKDFDKKSDDEKKKITDAEAKFNESNKANVDAEPARKKALLDFVNSGKGLVGIHAATDAYSNGDGKDIWQDYAELIGGCFNGHPFHKINIKVDDPKSPINALFEGKNFDFSDEIYTYKNYPNHTRAKLHVLLSLDLDKCGFKKDEKDPTKYVGENRADHDYAVAWIKKAGNGRVFYTLLGHQNETYYNPLSVKFFLGGIQYALGDLKCDDSPSDPKAPIPPAPANWTK